MNQPLFIPITQIFNATSALWMHAELMTVPDTWQSQTHSRGLLVSLLLHGYNISFTVAELLWWRCATLQPALMLRSPTSIFRWMILTAAIFSYKVNSYLFVTSGYGLAFPDLTSQLHHPTFATHLSLIIIVMVLTYILNHSCPCLFL